MRRGVKDRFHIGTLIERMKELGNGQDTERHRNPRRITGLALPDKICGHGAACDEESVKNHAADQSALKQRTGSYGRFVHDIGVRRIHA